MILLAIVFMCNFQHFYKLCEDAYQRSFDIPLQHFTKLSPAGTPGPKPRSNHASTIISTSTQDHLLVMGGWGDNIINTLWDCWILDPASRRWSEVNNDDY